MHNLQSKLSNRKVQDLTIQKLRALAVIAVIVFHSKSTYFPNGYLGVDVFFVISGYLILPKMMCAFAEGQLRMFYIRRIRRLTPAFSVMLVFSLLLILIFSNFSVHQAFVYQGMLSLFFLGNFGAVLISGNYFSPQSFMPLLHTWSLAVEEQIYFLLPLILKFKSRLLLPILSGISLGVYSVGQFVPENVAPWFFYMTLPRIWEFLVGGFLAVNLSPVIKFCNQKVYFYLALSFLTLVLFSPISVNTFAGTLVVVVLSGIILRLSPLLKSRRNIISAIGDRSYSLYLFHMPIIFTAKFTTVVYGTDRSKLTLLAILITFVVTEISFRKIEFKFVRF
jgi:peptidoglycan/LPS O-acetylase OafA/YrhL